MSIALPESCSPAALLILFLRGRGEALYSEPLRTEALGMRRTSGKAGGQVPASRTCTPSSSTPNPILDQIILI